MKLDLLGIFIISNKILKSKYGGGGMSAFGWMANFCGGMLGLTIGGCDNVDAGPSIITDVGDTRSDEDLVYAVGVNPLEGRVMIMLICVKAVCDF